MQEYPEDNDPETTAKMIEYSLSITPEERLLIHQHALDTINELIKARKQLYGEPEPPTETPSGT